jgi:hypothetical protein
MPNAKRLELEGRAGRKAARCHGILLAAAGFALSSCDGGLDRAQWQAVPESKRPAPTPAACRHEVKASDPDFFEFALKGFRPLLEASVWRWAYTESVIRLCSDFGAGADAKLTIRYALPRTVLAPGRNDAPVDMAVNGARCCRFVLTEGGPETVKVRIPASLLEPGTNSLRWNVDPKSLAPGQPLAFIFVSARLE